RESRRANEGSPHDRRSARRPVDGLVERSMGRRHARRRGHRQRRSHLVRSSRQLPQQPAQGYRALYVARCQPNAVRSDDRGPGDVLGAVDDLDAPVPQHRAECRAARVQVRRILREPVVQRILEGAAAVGFAWAGSKRRIELGGPMRVSGWLSVLGGGLLAAVAAPVVAHHSFAAEFDINRPIKLDGVVTKMQFSNPHSWLHIEVTTATGEKQQWAVEGGAPNALIRNGWNRNSVVPGTKVHVEGFQAKDRTFRASGRDITLENGTSLFMGQGGAAAPSAE